jgi:hypothetical protein
MVGTAVLACLARGAPARAGVIVQPWGPPTTETYPPDKRPDDMPADEDGDANADLTCGGGSYSSQWDAAKQQLTITAVDGVTVGGSTTIRVPEGAPASLVEHENTHDRLFKYEYEQRAKKKLEAALEGFVGMKFDGQGDTEAAREHYADSLAAAELEARSGRACDAIHEQMQAISDKFDKLTEHNKSETVTNAQGETETKAEQERAPAAGKPGRVPDTGKQSAHSDSQQGAFFDPTTWSLGFALPEPLSSAAFPSDPVVGRARVVIDPMVVIGLQPDGTVLLSDTHFRLLDTVSPDTLLDGFLLQTAYLPPNAFVYPEMIQATLDVPPAYAHGVNNTIGSAFLGALQLAADVGDTTMVWLFPAGPMFDPAGSPTVPPEGVPVAVTIGMASAPTTGVGLESTPGWIMAASPTPFRQASSIRFELAPDALPRVDVFDVRGARVRRLVAERLGTGWASATWDGRRDDGSPAGAGLYFIAVTVGGCSRTSRVVYLR